MSFSNTSYGYLHEKDADQLRAEQTRDIDLDIFLAWLKDKTIPSEGALFLASPVANIYWINKERCVWIDNRLYCWNKQGTYQCLVLFSGMKELALRVNHDIPFAGHQGVGRT